MKEIWKDVKGYEGLYKVSNKGRVKSKRKILKPIMTEYKKVGLSKNGIQKTIYVHRLVAEAFVDNPFNKKQVNHKDENKANNNANNLEWVTFKENMNYGTKQLRESINHTKYNIIQYDLNGNFIKRWFNAKEIENDTNFKASSIRFCCTGKYKTAYGFKWKYSPVTTF